MRVGSVGRLPGVDVLRVFRKTANSLGLVATGTYVTVLELGIALMLLAMTSGVGDMVFARGTSLLRAIGRCSYEVYLTHMFVVLGFFMAFRAIFGKEVPHPAIYPASFVVMLVVSVLLGHLVSRLFSEPANRALRAWLTTRMRSRAPTGTLATDPT